MKFYAEPNLYVRITQKNLRNGLKSGFYFDENGEYETDNPRLIARMKTMFKYDEPKAENELPFDDIKELKHEEENKTIDIKETKKPTPNKVKKVVRNGKYN